MAAMLDFTNNAMSRVLSDPITLPGVPKNPKIENKIMNLPLFNCDYISLMLDLGQMAAIFERGGHLKCLL